jgi:hypothetical protein
MKMSNENQMNMEVKESEEWEEIRMSILSYGIEKGLEQAKEYFDQFKSE